MRKLLFAVALLCLCLPASAINKCEIDGETIYTEKPCSDGTSTSVSEPPAPDDTAEARHRALQERTALRRMEKNKAARAAKEKLEQDKAERVAAAKKKKCAPLAQRMKWAKEDLATAEAKSLEQAKKKARRAEEKYALECPA